MQRTGAGREMVIKPVQFGNTATLITHMQLCYQSKHERQSLILGMKLNLGVILPIEVDLRRASVEIEPELSEVKEMHSEVSRLRLRFSFIPISIQHLFSFQGLRNLY